MLEKVSGLVKDRTVNCYLLDEHYTQTMKTIEDSPMINECCVISQRTRIGFYIEMH